MHLGLLDVIYFLVAGVVLGLASMELTKKLIKVRIKPEMDVLNIDTKYSPVIWATVFAACLMLSCIRFSSIYAKAEFAVMLCIISCAFMVDVSIRRLPNELLLAVLAVKIVSVTVDCFTNGFAIGKIVTPLLGLAVAMVIFFAPALLHLAIGNGDIKYGAVIGFFFGARIFQAMVIMAIVDILIYVFLRISKKGGMKTYIPIIPLLSIGAVATMLFPVL